ncbi:hypothetical protein [Marivita sp. XM-24bin2]|uniref:hypothetical protein n=1 Tax=unclassified Marivita TaxID=2632480 RepID=UPI000D78E846|nr:hypothetical protein [Marivita sp. XM-24bin2]MCR9107288.1 hypothetical protein [Paracoccaceae bacterium]PWL36586.1 MAG: hypothetical protein DCO97_03670 [Marivita sp. XM-24bin2]
MPHGTKIATCCYCGTRAALVLKGKTRHELSCSACGAPLHDMKMLRSDTGEKSAPAHRHASTPKTASTAPFGAWDGKSGGSKKKKPKKRKTLTRRFFEEAFDVIEDIFD